MNPACPVVGDLIPYYLRDNEVILNLYDIILFGGKVMTGTTNESAPVDFIEV